MEVIHHEPHGRASRVVEHNGVLYFEIHAPADAMKRSMSRRRRCCTAMTSSSSSTAPTSATSCGRRSSCTAPRTWMNSTAPGPSG